MTLKELKEKFVHTTKHIVRHHGVEPTLRYPDWGFDVVDTVPRDRRSVIIEMYYDQNASYPTFLFGVARYYANGKDVLAEMLIYRDDRKLLFEMDTPVMDPHNATDYQMLIGAANALCKRVPC